MRYAGRTRMQQLKEEKNIPAPETDSDQLEEIAMEKKSSMLRYGIYGVLVLLGLGTGYLLSRQTPGTIAGSGEVINTAKVAGVNDTKTFKDAAEGVLEAGGIEGEGTHKLIRSGGPSQTAYLTSSIVDLDEFVGKKVRVWGQTMLAKKAPWFMDVGKIEILE